jgi:tRNA (mo5U34)-methyltransferase
LEQRLAGDPTIWWVPNRACNAAMVRSAGFDIVEQPDDDVILARVSAEPLRHAGAVYPANVQGGAAT